MNSRREFIKTLVAGGAAIGLAGTPLRVLAGEPFVKLSILHTNDTHSRIEPFPQNDKKYGGTGGFARRAAIISRIRKQEKHVLLLDAGDVFQGTPYFNFYHGEPEFRLMNSMGYDAMNIGNHEFDAGIEELAVQAGKAEFSLLSANYHFDGTPLAGLVHPWKIFTRGSLRIGVFGLGVELKGLVNPSLYGNTRWSDPTEMAAETSHLLKKTHKCNMVICLSHLGFSYKDSKISDSVLAKQSKNIDLIIGGHTHTLLEKPVTFKNSDHEDVMVAQVGWGGTRLGKIDFYFLKNGSLKIADADTIKICEKYC